MFFGSTDGYVYQMDKGTSFNGNPITAVARFRFNNLKSPQTNKRIRRIVPQIDAPRYTYLFVSVDFDYGNTGNDGIAWSDLVDPESPAGYWDIADWDDLVWDGKSTDSPMLRVKGGGLNFGLMFYHSGEWELQDDEDSPRSGLTGAGSHTLQGYTVHYSNRRKQK